MTDIWFTSDNHFGHENAITLCNRPFGSVEEMNEIMIERWNLKVKKNDIVYHLGDFTLGNDAGKYFDRLNGTIFILKNRWHHDKRWLNKKGEYLLRVNFLEPIYRIRIDYAKIILCHFPIEDWEGMWNDSIHLHGHSHGNSKIKFNRIDVGVDCWKFCPINLEQIRERIAENGIFYKQSIFN